MYVIGIIIGVMLGLTLLLKVAKALVRVIASIIKHPDMWKNPPSSCFSSRSSSKSIAEQVRDGIALSDIEHGRSPGNWGTSHYYK